MEGTVQPYFIGQTIIAAKRDFSARLDSKLSGAGVTLRELHGQIIPALSEKGPTRMVDLAGHCGVRPQSMMTAINELERMGYVRRLPSTSDARAKLIELTHEGASLMRVLRELTEAVWRDYASIVGAEQLQQAIHTLAKIVSGPQREQA